MTTARDEIHVTCEICTEDLSYCTCVRCLTCEELSPEDAGMAADRHGDPICRDCA